jgi:hypothetical protein
MSDNGGDDGDDIGNRLDAIQEKQQSRFTGKLNIDDSDESSNEAEFEEAYKKANKLTHEQKRKKKKSALQVSIPAPAVAHHEGPRLLSTIGYVAPHLREPAQPTAEELQEGAG